MLSPNPPPPKLLGNFQCDLLNCKCGSNYNLQENKPEAWFYRFRLLWLVLTAVNESTFWKVTLDSFPHSVYVKEFGENFAFSKAHL